MTVCSEICRKVMLLSQVKGVGAVKIKQICARENINVPLENIADILSRYVKSTPEDIYGQLKKAGDFVSGEKLSSMPRPFGLSGWVKTPAIS